VRKKLPILVILALLLGVPAAYYWIGLKAEAILETQRAALEDRCGVRITLAEKHRGVFSSTYRYDVTAPLSLAAPATAATSRPLAFGLRVTLGHGPIPFASGEWTPALAVLDCGLEPKEGTSGTLPDLLAAVPELGQSTLRATFAFSGDSRTRLAVPAGKRTITQEDGTPLEVEWQAITGLLDATPDAESLTLDLQAPLARVADKQAATVATAKGLSLTGASKRSRENLYLGSSVLSLADLRVENTQAEAESFALTNFTLSVTTTPRDDMVDCLLAVRGDGVDLKTQAKASLDAAFSLKNLDAAALDTLAGEMRRINRQRTSPEVRLQLIQVLLLRQGSALLARQPRFAVEKLVLAAPSGSLEASGFVAYSGQGEPPANILAALGLFTASVKARAGEQTVLDILAAAGRNNPAFAGSAGRPMAETALRDMIGSGFVVRDKGVLSAAAEWNGKALTVNGVPVFRLP
jgi:uncharacterized protein YdgA (DUF945 family)